MGRLRCISPTRADENKGSESCWVRKIENPVVAMRSAMALTENGKPASPQKIMMIAQLNQDSLF